MHAAPARYDVRRVEKLLSPTLVDADQRLINILRGRKLEFARLKPYEPERSQGADPLSAISTPATRLADIIGGDRTKQYIHW